MIIDGRKLAAETLARAKARAEKLPHPPRVLALVANETPATKSYLAIKKARAAGAGCIFGAKSINKLLRPSEIVDMAKDADAIIVQLPLSEGMNQKEILDAIPVKKDADVLSRNTREKFERGDADALLPPVVGAVRTILEFGNVKIAGKKVVIIGAGFLVGAPVASWLAQQGAKVITITNKSGDLIAVLRAADIIVSGAGSPHLIKPEMLKQGVILIDAGTSESGDAIAGDADPACAEKCSIFTPVPGGVGPLAVACLFENVVTLATLGLNKRK